MDENGTRPALLAWLILIGLIAGISVLGIVLEPFIKSETTLLIGYDVSIAATALAFIAVVCAAVAAFAFLRGGTYSAGLLLITAGISTGAGLFVSEASGYHLVLTLLNLADLRFAARRLTTEPLAILVIGGAALWLAFAVYRRNG